MDKIPTQLDQDIADLKRRAEALRSDARELQRTTDVLNREADSLEREAAELIAPFKIGDVIEYEKAVGWGDRRKTQKRRMIVRNMEIEGNRLSVQGRRVNMKGEIGYSEWITLGGNAEKFLRIVSQKE